MKAPRVFAAFRAPWWRAMTVDEAAAEWIVRRDSPRWSDADAASLEAWLAESEAHRSAFDRAERAWAQFDAADEEPLLQSMRRSAASAGPDRPELRWRALAAASLAAIVLAGAIWLNAGGRVVLESRETEQAAQASPASRAALSRRGEADYATVRGQRADVTLPDGTRVTLNTDSALDVAFESNRRVVHLLRGQAFFDVAHNPARPFVVEAADRRITALGTQFDVRIDPASLQVLLVTGRVRVDREAGASAGAQDSATAAVELSPGQQLVIALGAPAAVAVADVETATAWRRGLVQFNDVPLGIAVAELNRYAPEPLVIRDPRIADLRVSGVFRTGDPERFGRIIGELLPVKVERTEAGESQLNWDDTATPAPRPTQN